MARLDVPDSLHPISGRCVCSLVRRVVIAEALAGLFGGGSSQVVPSVKALRSSKCTWALVRARNKMASVECELDRASAALSGPDDPERFVAVREAAFHPTVFDPKAAILSPCESVYVAADPRDHARSILDVYAASGFEPVIAMARCCPGHIAVELEYYSSLLRTCMQAHDPRAHASAQHFLETHLLAWAPLFATVLTSQGWHSVLRAGGLALESYLFCEADRYRRDVEAMRCRLVIESGGVTCTDPQ